MESNVWNADVDEASYGAGAAYRGAILEQYKLYVEMADRLSARRGLTNSFFLTVNTGVFTLIALFWKDRPGVDPLALVLPTVVAVLECGAWWWLLRSYRQLNGAKFQVIGLLEARLPASPYWRAEWGALGEGKDKRKYVPLTHLEQWVPVLFAAVYVTGLVLALMA